MNQFSGGSRQKNKLYTGHLFLKQPRIFIQPSHQPFDFGTQCINLCIADMSNKLLSFGWQLMDFHSLTPHVWVFQCYIPYTPYISSTFWCGFWFHPSLNHKKKWEVCVQQRRRRLERGAKSFCWGFRNPQQPPFWMSKKKPESNGYFLANSTSTGAGRRICEPSSTVVTTRMIIYIIYMFSRESQSYPSLQFEDAEILCDLWGLGVFVLFSGEIFWYKTKCILYCINEYVHTRIHAEIMDFLGLSYKIFQGFTWDMNTRNRPQGRCHITNPKNQKCSEYIWYPIHHSWDER